MKIVVTGAAGFIGFHICQQLLEKGHEVIGLDRIDAYYDVHLKYARLAQLGIAREKAEVLHQEVRSSGGFSEFVFVRIDLKDYKALEAVFQTYQPEAVCHLAAQAGVRYSLENPRAYIESNMVGFFNVLEGCRHYRVAHLVYASSSSVYGNATSVPFKTTDRVDRPVSLYAATKKSNELMAHTYSHLYGLVSTGLRFFTVYGPWGRPDMAPFLFTDAIIKGNPIKVFNRGEMERDFTYIDDVVEGVARVVLADVTLRKNPESLYKVYNIGNNTPIQLNAFIRAIEDGTGLQAKRNLLPMQAGDVTRTWAHIEDFIEDYGYQPSTSIQEGVGKFIAWYKAYFGLLASEDP